MANDKPYRVVTPHGLSWAAKFKTEEAAWGRILGLNGRLLDTRSNRALLLRQGWAVKKTEPPGYDLGGTPA